MRTYPPAPLFVSVLRNGRLPTIALLLILPLVCWAWVVVLARDMYGPMTGASAWMMTSRWDGQHLVLLWAMWAVMMTAMMLPSAIPALLLLSGPGGGPTRPILTYAAAAGYMTVWALGSVVATGLQWALATSAVLSPMMEINGSIPSAVLLGVAGVYQLTPLKRVCLARCQSPMGFLMHRWRPGAGGAFRVGIEHGAYCVGCCWALMLLLFAGGVMNLVVIVALTLFVAFEKLSPFGVAGARVSGVLLLGTAAWMAFR